MFDIYKYDRRLLDDYMGICNDLETALKSFDTLHSDIYAAFEALQEEAEDIEERINICSMRLGNASRAHCRRGLGKDAEHVIGPYACSDTDWIPVDDDMQIEFQWNTLKDN